VGLRGFNPTLVRLRHPGRRVSGPASGSFQSHAGSIEARIRLPGRAPARVSFNPTLVRLRLVHWGKHKGKTLSEFQSHAGSIEARSLSSPIVPGAVVSIPRWFD